MNVNELNENVFNEIFSYLNLKERSKCELICKKWYSILNLRNTQRSLKLCLDSKSKVQRSICSNKHHNINQTTDILYLDPDSINLYQIDNLFLKFKFTIKSIHLQAQDIRSLRKSNLLANLSRYSHNLTHLQIQLFNGPFSKNDLQSIFKSWSKNLKCLILIYENDLGKILNSKFVMKFFEILVNLEFFYLKSPFLTEQILEYIPIKLNSLHFKFDNEINLETLELIIKENGKIFKELKIGNINEVHLNKICSNLLNLNLLSVDCIQMNNYSKLVQIQNLTNLMSLKFWLEEEQLLDNEFSLIIKNCSQMKRCHIENILLTDESLKLIPIYWKNLELFKLYLKFNPNSQITDNTLSEFIKLKNLKTLALPNFKFSIHLLEQLIDKSKFNYLILRESCKYVDKLINRIKENAQISSYNNYKLKVNYQIYNLYRFNFDLPNNFQIKPVKYFNFDELFLKD